MCPSSGFESPKKWNGWTKHATNDRDDVAIARTLMLPLMRSGVPNFGSKHGADHSRPLRPFCFDTVSALGARLPKFIILNTKQGLNMTRIVLAALQAQSSNITYALQIHITHAVLPARIVHELKQEGKKIEFNASNGTQESSCFIRTGMYMP